MVTTFLLGESFQGKPVSFLQHQKLMASFLEIVYPIWQVWKIFRWTAELVHGDAGHHFYYVVVDQLRWPTLRLRLRWPRLALKLRPLGFASVKVWSASENGACLKSPLAAPTLPYCYHGMHID